jgi:hypothetical protein
MGIINIKRGDVPYSTYVRRDVENYLKQHLFYEKANMYRRISEKGR